MLNLEKVTINVSTENIYSVMLKTSLVYKGVTKAKIGKKLVSIGANGGFVFARCKSGIVMQLKENLAPYLVAMVVHITPRPLAI